MTSPFARALSHYETLFSGLAVTTTRRSASWRHEYLVFRRQVNEAMQSLHQALSTLDPDDTAAREARDLLTRLQFRVSLHQAEWPVIAIDLDDPAYVESRRTADEASHAFIQSARRLVSAR